MKKVIKILAGSFLAVASTTAIVTPIEITKKSNDNNSSIMTNNINNTKISTTTNHNVNSILSKVPETKVENIINNYFAINSSKNNILFIQESSNTNKDGIIVNKAKQIVNELYTNQISLSTLRQNIQNKFNDLTITQKEYIQSRIKKQENLNNKVNSKSLMFCYPTLLLTQQNVWNTLLTNADLLTQNIQYTLNKLGGIKIFASTLTALAIAAIAIAAVEWAELFVGWAAAACTTAAVVSDWITVGFAWTYYYQILNPMQNIVSSDTFHFFKYIKSQCRDLKWCINGPNKIETMQNNLKKAGGWISQKLRNIFNIAQENGQKLTASIDTDQAVNDADMWADPSDSAVTTIISVADTLITKIFGYLNATISIIALIETLYLKY